MKKIQDPVWESIRASAQQLAVEEPVLAKQITGLILDRQSLEEAISYQLAAKLTYLSHWEFHLEEVFLEVLKGQPAVSDSIRRDLIAICDRDAACTDLLTPLLHFKGFKAITTHRISHQLWLAGRRHLALHLQSLTSEFFGVDIHPAARFGAGIMLDHATGFVAGETSVVDDDVSILHSVTLGGTGKDTGDRHPKIRAGVLIGAGAKILGNIIVGKGARVGANSVVLSDVPEHVTVAGVPARVVGHNQDPAPAHHMDHRIRTQGTD